VKLRIDGGRLLDLTDGSRIPVSVLIDTDSGTILSIGTDLPEADQTIRLHGETLLPGFIDVHVHLRDPGFEAKETLATGTEAAAAGGYTQVACMPNTRPPLDRPGRVRDVRLRAKGLAARVHPIACITLDQAGEQLTDFAALKAEGAIALSDDGRGVQRSDVMREALRQAAVVGLPVAIHAEDEALSGGGALTPEAAARLDVSASPAEAETAMIARDLILAEATGAHLHICHVSTQTAVSLIRWAKSRGIRVTAEVTPHHLLLDSGVIDRDDAVYKVNPPLRTAADKAACLEGFLDGTLDLVATDHAPHTAEEKAAGIERAPFGMVGLETAFPLLYTHLVETGRMRLEELVRRMATLPARHFGLQGGVIRPGGCADLTAVDLAQERVVDPHRFRSKGRNTPFTGWRLRGWPVLTVCEGRVTFSELESAAQ
jgi:dihydroorotase